MLAATGIALALATLHLAVTPAVYTATAVLVPDTKRAPPSPAEIASETLIDPAVLESQVETLKSEAIAATVINKLKLWSDPEFVGTGPGWFRAGWPPWARWTARTHPRQAVNQRTALASFKRQLRVLRAGRSYITEISFSSRDPNKAATIANEVAEAYIQDQLGAKFFQAQRAASWMQQRIDDLRQQADTAARALEAFRAAHPRPWADSGREDESGRLLAAKLRELEASAQTQRALYDSLANRSARVIQFAQQQSFPVTEARLLSEATPPLAKSAPRTGVTLLLALFAGAGLGIAAAFVQDHVNRSIANPQQIEQELGVRCLGFLPLLAPQARGVTLDRLAERCCGGMVGETLKGVQIALDGQVLGPAGRAVGIISRDPETARRRSRSAWRRFSPAAASAAL